YGIQQPQGVLSLERNGARNQFVKHYAQGENIGLKFWFAFPDLWSHVRCGASDKSARHFAGSCHTSRDTKVGHFNCAVLATDENVGRLQISVVDVFGVNGPESFRDGLDDVRRFWKRKATFLPTPGRELG